MAAVDSAQRCCAFRHRITKNKSRQTINAIFFSQTVANLMLSPLAGRAGDSDRIDTGKAAFFHSGGMPVFAALMVTHNWQGRAQC